MFVAFELNNFRSMKKIIAILIILAGVQPVSSQVVNTVWASDFEYGGLPEPCSDTSNYRDTTRASCIATPSCTQSHGKDWGITNKLKYNGSYADSAQVNFRDTLWFSTCAFSTMGDTFVTVEFQHICKVSFFDGGVVEVSNDSGLTWDRLGATQYIRTKPYNPLWNSILSPPYGLFSENSYTHIGGNKWKAGFDSIPKNSWWEYEYFNASSFLGGVNNSANCMLRFGVIDGPVTPGNENRYGWLIDSIRVKSAPCENIKPFGVNTAPNIYNGSLIYSTGPYQIYARMYDDPVAYSGFDEAWLFYTVNGGPVDSVQYDSIFAPAVPNTNQDSVYRAVLPRAYNGIDSIMPGDTVCYWTIVYDRSIPCRNSYKITDAPNISCNTFFIATGQQLPYCDDFENPLQSNFWDTSMYTGLGNLGWQLGNPQAGGGYPAHSGTRAWTTVLAGNYLNNNEYDLNSPIFDFTTAVTPRITFWRRHSMPTQASDVDRYRLEYSVNGNPWQILGTGYHTPTVANGDPAGTLLNAPQCPTTWYNTTTDNPNRGWGAGGVSTVAGNQNGVWRETFYQLPASFTGQTQVQFRFKFKSDNNALQGYGVSIDDWCLKNPPAVDVSVLRVIRPAINDYIKRAGELDSVRLEIRNLGTDTLSAIPLCFDIRDEFGAVDTTICYTVNYPRPSYPGGLPPLSVDIINLHNLNLAYTVPQRLYQIVAYPNIVNDADSSNDTAWTAGHFGFVIDTISHGTGFDFNPAKWATTLTTPPVNICGQTNPPQLTRWKRGAPNFGTTNSTFSPPNSWDINLDTGYAAGATEFLYTNFFDMSNADSAFLSFWHNWNTISQVDGYYLDFSFNRFVSFTRLTAASQPIGRKTNWIESYLPIAGGIGRGWNGLSQGWEYSQVPLNNFNFTNQSEVQFRFVFRSATTSTGLDGVSVDDFRIVNPDLYDAEMFDVVLPERGCVLDIEEPVEIVVKNVGKDTIADIHVFYQFRFDATCAGAWGPWSAPTADTITDYILPGLDRNFIFDDSVNMSTFGCYQFRTWLTHPADNNQTNDSLFEHEAENVRGCNIDFQITTRQSPIPDGEIIMQDSASLDTLWLQPLTGIGPGAIQWQADICLPEKGTYLFSITSTNANMLSYWRLRDPFGDSIVLDDTIPVSEYFKWVCPPLLSASAERIRTYGPAPLPIPQTYNIDVTTRNRGSVNLRYVWLTTEITQLLPLPFNGLQILSFTDSLYFGHVGDPILFPRINTLDTTWVAKPGLYEICSWTFLPNGNADSATFDDTVCTKFVVLDTVSSLPYCNNFDSNFDYPWAGMSKTTYDTASTFEQGTPAQSHINSARSPQRAWMVDLDANYPILDSSALYSPEFEVDTSICLNIEFYHKWKTEHSFDGGTVEFTADSGRTWQVVGGVLNTVDTAYPWSTKNWFNTPYVTGLAGQPHPPGWTAFSQTSWTHSFRDFKLPDIGQNPMKIIFRFRFGSDASVEYEGWAIDDFCLEDNGLCDYISCGDGIMNGDEDGIDCGGTEPGCPPCESCFDGVLNQNEQGVDCGGVCAPCPSCFDGIKNGNEVQQDCGGPDCEPCGECNDGIRSWNWCEIKPTGVFVLKFEDGIDCFNNENLCDCPPCWLGIDDLDPNTLFLGQSIPNPASGKALIRYQLPKEGNSTIIIRSTLGQEMKRIELNNQSSGIHQVEIDVASWAQGLYYVSLEFDGEQLIEKMVVERK